MKPITLRLIVAFLAALILTIMPLPEFLLAFRPPWILLLMLYLQFYLPEHFKIVLLFAMGLVLDTLLSTVIGEHVFALTLVCWLASSKARRFYFFSISQQMALISVFCMLYQFTVLLIDAFLGHRVGFWSVPGVGLLSILLWPWMRLLAEEILPGSLEFSPDPKLL